MKVNLVEHDTVVWMVADLPARMVYAGHRWRVTDMPTRLTEPVWALPLHGPRHMYGWRFQATNETGEALVFDVIREDEGWQVLEVYR